MYFNKEEGFTVEAESIKEKEIKIYEEKLYEELRQHIGHKINLFFYGNPMSPQNMSIECISCGNVLLSIDKPNT